MPKQIPRAWVEQNGNKAVFQECVFLCRRDGDMGEKAYPNELHYTFASDFAIADWISGVEGVKETYERVKKEWLSNVKAWTEVVISLNLLSWAHNQLKKQGISDREKYIDIYSELYYMAMDSFYEEYVENEEAKSYFFEMTD